MFLIVYMIIVTFLKYDPIHLIYLENFSLEDACLNFVFSIGKFDEWSRPCIYLCKCTMFPHNNHGTCMDSFNMQRSEPTLPNYCNLRFSHYLSNVWCCVLFKAYEMHIIYMLPVYVVPLWIIHNAHTVVALYTSTFVIKWYCLTCLQVSHISNICRHLKLSQYQICSLHYMKNN